MPYDPRTSLPPNHPTDAAVAPPELPMSLPEHAQLLLEREIVVGALPAGSRVSEHELAARIGISRTPVREALRVLEAQGLIVRRHSRGVFVADRTTAVEAEAIYRLRVPLESSLTGWAALELSEQALEEVARHHDDVRSAFERALAEPEALTRVVEADSRFHWAIYDAARSDLTSVVRSYWGRLVRELYARVYSTERSERFAAQHGTIVAALRDRDARAAADAMAEHITLGWEAVRKSYESDRDGEETG